MERFEELREKAVQKIKVADHMLTITFPMIKDPRMLPAILEDIFLGMSYAMQSILSFEATYKRIPIYENSYRGRMLAFTSYCMDRLKIDAEAVATIREIRHLLLLHQKSPTEFVRNNTFIICGTDFSTAQITEGSIKNYLKKAKDFVHAASFIVKKEKIA